jgi:multidrug efflux system membrane fusion protein
MKRFAVVAVLVIAGLVAWRLAVRAPADTKPKGPLPVPVSVTPASVRDVPVYLDGLGTVQASETVTVTAQVTGKLTAVLFHEGQDVEKGQVLATIDPRTYQATLDQAVAKKAQDEATLANDTLNAARYQKLVGNSYTSQQQADTAKAQVAVDRAQVGQDQAQIENAQAQLSYTTITAPISGRLGIRQIDAGNIIQSAGTTGSTTGTTGLVVITKLKPIDVVFTLPQQQLPLVAAAIAAGPVAVLAEPQDGTRDVLDRGVLKVLDNQVDSTTGTIKLKAEFPNTKLTLWPGAFVTVRLLARTIPGAVTIQSVAVQQGPDGDFVYLARDGRAVRQGITVGPSDGGLVVVSKGLKEGDAVVTDGTSRLSDGRTLRVLPPAAPAS